MASCTCTNNQLGSSILQPGESTTLDLRVNVPASYVDSVIDATLKTDHPDFKYWRYRVRFVAYPAGRIDPELIDFGVLDPNSSPEPRSSFFEIYHQDGVAADELDRIEHDSDLLVERAGDPSIDKPHPNVVRIRYPLRVSLVDDPSESRSGVITRGFNAFTRAGMARGGKVSWRRLSKVECSPANVHFGLVPRSTRSTEAVVLIRRTDDAPLRILRIESSEFVVAEFPSIGSQPEPQPLQKIKLRMRSIPDSTDGALHGSIAVFTDAEDRPTRIQWSAFVE
ncbi:MAG: hypothetical protein SFX72_09645 [Isosphaeraceae bacterium]|nr:hypothetical protein [Isosphaeraceae bacterium]